MAVAASYLISDPVQEILAECIARGMEPEAAAERAYEEMSDDEIADICLQVLSDRARYEQREQQIESKLGKKRPERRRIVAETTDRIRAREEERERESQIFDAYLRSKPTEEQLEAMCIELKDLPIRGLAGGVTWGNATRDQLSARASMFRRNAEGSLRSAKLCEAVIGFQSKKNVDTIEEWYQDR